MSLNSRRPLGTIPQSPEQQRAQSARTALDILYEMSTLLNTGLDRQSLAHCVKLLEDGTNPDALAAVIRDLRAEAKKQAER
ncbi:mitotic-spindle organizing gamma-tubulin ring associated-domain-containing protein [Leucosporidium creatinivorum]|uniref:Mitotic-spindle organizing protein 1 n=1 Tax=Leucosporidium creatinivorum TaxID=106004 RepID=A0A1Y2EU06_9BASI|nr:mitotic-spindle organizing gamma-tubulin ring associated-domain-containing protein [Leucosporidium creatinivorum]